VADDVELLLATRRFSVVRHVEQTDRGTVFREVVHHPGAVTILPRLPDGRIVMIRNYRVAVCQTLLELPAGTLEPGEDPDVTAARELAEETGYTAGSIQLLAQFWMSPGILRERMHLYLAEGLAAGQARPEPGEVIEPVLMPWEEALACVARGEIQDAKTLVGLLYYDRFGGRTAAPTS
jgi:ADP-ribose pyrophosphatase